MKAYLHISIFQGHYKILCFCIGENYLQFRALSFGLSTAPRAFSKLLIYPVVKLREQGVHIHPYLDDLLIRPNSHCKSVEDMEKIIQCLQAHGFLVKLLKCSLEPTQKLEQLWVLTDTMFNCLLLTDKKARKTRKW